MYKPGTFLSGSHQCVKHPIYMPSDLSTSLNRDARRFVQRNDVLVGVKNERSDPLSVLRASFTACRVVPGAGVFVDRRDANDLSLFETRRGFNPSTIDPDLTGAQKLFQSSMLETRKMTLEPPIDPNI
jgi:hypothetical protein